jgi:hypothetical protein
MESRDVAVAAPPSSRRRDERGDAARKATMEVECPHCFTLVSPAADGECPACRENTRVTSGQDPDRVTLTVGEHSQSPDVCCDCGLPTRRTTHVKRWKPPENAQYADGFLIVGVLLFGWLGSALAALHRIIRGRFGGQTVVVRIAQCHECVTSGAPDPLRVDHEHFTMRFLVHRDFARQFERLNGSSAGTPD